MKRAMPRGMARRLSCLSFCYLLELPVELSLPVEPVLGELVLGEVLLGEELLEPDELPLMPEELLVPPLELELEPDLLK